MKTGCKVSSEGEDIDRGYHDHAGVLSLFNVDVLPLILNWVLDGKSVSLLW